MLQRYGPPRRPGRRGGRSVRGGSCAASPQPGLKPAVVVGFACKLVNNLSPRFGLTRQQSSASAEPGFLRHALRRGLPTAASSRDVRSSMAPSLDDPELFRLNTHVWGIF